MPMSNAHLTRETRMPSEMGSAGLATTGVMTTGPTRPDPEVSEKPVRRRFTAEYKLRILHEADTQGNLGQIGALLRREGLYASHLTTWRRQRVQGALDALRPKKRGRKADQRSPLARRIAELERENQHLAHRLKQTETIIEVQKKVSEVLSIPLRCPDNGGHS